MNNSMQPNRKIIGRVSWIRIGFGIGVSISLLGYFGISAIIFAIDTFQIPKEQLTIYTSLFYGIIFFIAFSGVRVETRRQRMILSRKPYEEPSTPITTKARERIKRIRSISWGVFTIVALGWITPALIIYWMGPRHVARYIVCFSCLLGVAAGIVFVIRKIRDFKTAHDYFLFSGGLCLGMYLANSFGVGIWS
jgi:hypothetical protein